MKSVIITGINGQDGIFLSRLLIKQGYEVLGVGSQSMPTHHLPNKIRYFSIDIRNTSLLLDLIENVRPQLLFNLAGRSSVAESFKETEATFEVNGNSVIDLLNGIYSKNELRALKFFQASTSEMFGNAPDEGQSEKSPFNPVSPYAQSKLNAHLAAREFRALGYFVSSGIMFNHESIYRPVNFVTRKISSSIAKIKRGESSFFVMGNLFAERDWGFSGDFVRAMQLIIEHEIPDEFVVATGKLRSVDSLVNIALEEVGLLENKDDILRIDHNLYRPNEVNRLFGNPHKARQILGWSPKTDFEETFRGMVRYDLTL